jgi:hypothetical protein
MEKALWRKGLNQYLVEARIRIKQHETLRMMCAVSDAEILLYNQ